jgi:hypothetical protein
MEVFCGPLGVVRGVARTTCTAANQPRRQKYLRPIVAIILKWERISFVTTAGIFLFIYYYFFFSLFRNASHHHSSDEDGVQESNMEDIQYPLTSGYPRVGIEQFSGDDGYWTLSLPLSLCRTI